MRDGSKTAPILIAAVGNLLAGEDGIGPRVAAELSRRQLPGVQVIDLATSPSGLLDVLDERDVLILIDAIYSGGAPVESLLVCPWAGAAAQLAAGCRVSTHGLSIANQLELAETLGRLPPRVWLVGVTASQFELGSGDEVALSRQSREIADRVAELSRVLPLTEPAHA